MEPEPLSKKKKIIIWSACIAVLLLSTAVSGFFLYNFYIQSKNLTNLTRAAQPVDWSQSNQPNAEEIREIRRLGGMTNWKTDQPYIEKMRVKYPDNAFVEVHALRILTPQAFTVNHNEDDTHVILLDQKLAEESIKAFKNFMEKKDYKNYQINEFIEQRENDPSYYGLLNETSHALSYISPGLANFRRFTQFYLVYNNPDEETLKSRAAELTEFSRKLYKQSGSFIEQLVAGSIASITYRHLKTVDSELFKEKIKSLSYLYLLSRSNKNNDTIDELLPQFDTISRLIFPAIGAPSNLKEKLTNSRRLEYAHYDALAFAAMAPFAAFLAFSMILIIIRWHYTSEPKKPFLILPQKKHIIKSLGLSILLLALFLLLRNFLPSRGFGLLHQHNSFMYVSELICLFIAALIIPAHFLMDCLKSDLEGKINVPDKGKKIYFLLAGAVILNWSCSFYYSPDFEENIFMFIPCFLPAAVLVIYCFRFFLPLLQKKYADWHGSSARLLILTFAVFGVLTVSLPITFFKWIQRTHYENDKLLRCAYQDGYLTTYAEADIVEQIKAGIDTYEDLSDKKRTQIYSENRLKPPKILG